MPKINDGKLVAYVRATKKGHTLHLNHKGIELGGSGEDGRKVYEIRNQESGGWTCSCLSYRFKKGEVGKKAPCKHMLKLFNDYKKGCIDPSEIKVVYAAAL